MDTNGVLLVSCLAFLGVGFWYGYRYIIGLLDTHIDVIRENLTKTQSRKQEAIQLLIDEQKRKTDVEQQSVLIIQQAQEEAQRLKEAILQETEQLLAARRRVGEGAIESFQRQLSKSVHKQIVHKTLAVLEWWMMHKLTATQHKKINDEALDLIIANLPRVASMLKKTQPAILSKSKARQRT